MFQFAASVASIRSEYPHAYDDHATQFLDEEKGRQQIPSARSAKNFEPAIDDFHHAYNNSPNQSKPISSQKPHHLHTKPPPPSDIPRHLRPPPRHRRKPQLLHLTRPPHAGSNILYTMIRCAAKYLQFELCTSCAIEVPPSAPKTNTDTIENKVYAARRKTKGTKYVDPPPDHPRPAPHNLHVRGASPRGRINKSLEFDMLQTCSQLPATASEPHTSLETDYTQKYCRKRSARLEDMSIVIGYAGIEGQGTRWRVRGCHGKLRVTSLEVKPLGKYGGMCEVVGEQVDARLVWWGCGRDVRWWMESGYTLVPPWSVYNLQNKCRDQGFAFDSKEGRHASYTYAGFVSSSREHSPHMPTPVRVQALALRVRKVLRSHFDSKAVDCLVQQLAPNAS
ncbi:hypothetical protein IAQ61_008963, partial [Plenodomus lingam]|uniref:uncharacterized protein n=1 Tax=Leptosphaeria maculans TaxID=5022 RepID=UPI003332EFAD